MTSTRRLPRRRRWAWVTALNAYCRRTPPAASPTRAASGRRARLQGRRPSGIAPPERTRDRARTPPEGSTCPPTTGGPIVRNRRPPRATQGRAPSPGWRTPARSSAARPPSPHRVVSAWRPPLPAPAWSATPNDKRWALGHALHPAQVVAPRRLLLLIGTGSVDRRRPCTAPLPCGRPHVRVRDAARASRRTHTATRSAPEDSCIQRHVAPVPADPSPISAARPDSHRVSSAGRSG